MLKVMLPLHVQIHAAVIPDQPQPPQQHQQQQQQQPQQQQQQHQQQLSQSGSNGGGRAPSSGLLSALNIGTPAPVADSAAKANH